MHLNSELLFRKYALPYFKDGLRVLEIGPTGIPSVFAQIVNNNSITWDTIDFPDTEHIHTETSRLTYQLSDPYVFPVEEGLYDIVLSANVIEHVQKIWVWYKELKRVTKKGGHIITINPVSWPNHHAPLDCWRIYPSGMEALIEDTGLENVLCIFESLEAEQLLKRDPHAWLSPGKSYYYGVSTRKINFVFAWNKIVRKIRKLNGLLPLSLEVSYDTISIAKK